MKKRVLKKVEPITAKELFYKMLSENDECASTEMMIEFAKIKVTEALQETSKHFKNPDNVTHVLNHYKLDKIK